MADDEPTPEYAPNDLKRIEVKGEVYYIDEETRLLINIIDDIPIGYLDSEGETIIPLPRSDKEDEEVEVEEDPIDKYPDKDIPEQRLYDQIFNKEINIGDIFLIIFKDDKDNIEDQICTIEAIFIEDNKIILSGDDLSVTELHVTSELDILLKTEDYEIIDIEILSETEEKNLEDLSFKLSKEVIPDINFEDIITDDNEYSNSEQKEEILSDLIHLFNGFGKDKLLKELTDISEYYIIMIKESLKKKIENKEYLNFISDILNLNILDLPHHIKPIVSAKRNLYYDDSTEIDEDGNPLEKPSSVIHNASYGPGVSEDIKEHCSLLEREDVQQYDYRRHLNIDLQQYTNYQPNMDNKKFIVNYEGEYYRDCIKETCTGVNVQSKNSYKKSKTFSALGDDYNFDNLMTRKRLMFPNLVSEKTEFEILRDSEVINMVGLMFFHSKYSYRNTNLKLNKNIFSLQEISFLHSKSYSTEIFKNILEKAITISKEIDLDTEYNEEYNNHIKYYNFKNINDIDIETLGNILKKNLPDKREMILNLNENLTKSLFDVKNFEKLLCNYDIYINDLDIGLKDIVMNIIEENIKLYLSSYSKVTKKVVGTETLKQNQKVLTEAERSQKSLIYINKILNDREKNILLRRYCERFLRNPGFNEDKNYLYNKHDDEKGLCKHYEYLVNEERFDSMLNIWGGDIKDGFIVCKCCGAALCNEGFSGLQGFSDGAPVNTVEKMEESIESKLLTESQEKNKLILQQFEKLFNLHLNELDTRQILSILDVVNLDKKEIIEKRYTIFDSLDSVLTEHPFMVEIGKKYNYNDKSLKKTEKLKVKKSFDKARIEFINYLSMSNIILSLLFLLILFIQTAVPSYGMNIKYEMIIVDDQLQFSQLRNSLNSNMLTYLEKIMRQESKKNKGEELWENCSKLFSEKIGLNIYNHFYSISDYFSSNFTIQKRINKYKDFLKDGGTSVYLKESFPSFKPVLYKMIIEINKQVNDDKSLTDYDKSLENNSLMKEINSLDEEIYKKLGIEISEFMNNESYKRLIKYAYQIHGKSKQNLLINLLVVRLINTMTNTSIEGKFKSIGFKDNEFKNIDFSELKNVIIEEIPKLYSSREEDGTINDFIYIMRNNPDLQIMSLKTSESRINSYDPMNPFPINDYSTLKDENSNILNKIFGLFCKDEFGNIILKKNKNFQLNKFLLDLGEEVDMEDNCTEIFKETENNFQEYLEFLTNSNKLKHYPEKFLLYYPFYENELILEIELENIKSIIPNLKLNKFLEVNKYLSIEGDYCYDTLNSLYEINQEILSLEYLSNKGKEKSLRKTFTDIFSKIIEDKDYYLNEISEVLKKILSTSVNLLQLKKIETYYGLKSTAGLSGDQKIKDLKVNTISGRMIDSLTKILEKDNVHEKINIIKNMYSIISRLKNNHKFNSSVKENFSKISPKINKNNLDHLEEYMELKEFLLHKDVFYKTKIDYIGFNSYRDSSEGKGKYFEGLFDHISGYGINLDLLKIIDSKIFLSEGIYINDLLNYILLFILNRMGEYLDELSEDESDPNKNAIILFTLLEEDFEDHKEKTIRECSALILDLIQNMIEEFEDPGYLHENKNLDDFSRQMGKQKEREKSFLVSELTGQSNENRLLTTELQKNGLSNWFDSLSKRNDEYKQSDQYAEDAEDERIRRMIEMSEGFESERDLFKKQGIEIDELIANRMSIEEELPEDLGYGGGKIHDGDPEDEEDETDGYDN